ncbi:class B sortase [uncultured Faecalibaculum sp.]|nr:class B sortase [uncultured Faecalibaculum sp.]
MENGGMYGDVTKFLDEKYFESHKTGALYNDTCTWDISLFAVLKTDAGDPVVYNAGSYKNSASDVVSYLEQNALHYRSVPSDSQVIALSTCYDTETNGRVIVFGRLENKREVKDS